MVDGVRDLAWALADQVVYFQSDSMEGIHAITTQGGDTQAAVPTANANRPLQLHAGYIYWSEQFFPDASSFDNQIQRIWRAAMQGGEPQILVNEPNSILTEMAMDDEAIYYGLVGVLPECGCEGSYLKAVAHGSRGSPARS